MAIGRWRPLLTEPDPCPPGFPLTARAAPYDERMHNVINAFKERQAWWLRGLLAERLAGAVEHVLADHDHGDVLLVPMPSDPASVRERGYDVTMALAGGAASVLRRRGRRVAVARHLKHRRRLLDQAGLDSEQRWANLHGGLTVRGRTSTRAAVVVVDDVVTTGASLSEAARALTEAGTAPILAAVIAATQRRTESSAG